MNANSKWSPLTLEQRKEHIQRIYVRFKPIRDAWEVLEMNFAHGIRLREAGTGFIIGNSRCGKPEAIKRFIFEKTGKEIKRPGVSSNESDGPIKLLDGKGVRIVYADMTNGMSPHIASRTILRDLFGSLKANTTIQADGAAEVVKHFRKHQIDMMIVDESQQMFNGQGPQGPGRLARWLLPLQNAAAFGTVLCGAPELARIMNIEATNRRKIGYKKIFPFDFKTALQKAAFAKFVRQFAVQLPFDANCFFEGVIKDGKLDVPLLLPVYYATRGCPGELSKLCELATIYAFKESADPRVLTKEHLANAFDFNSLDDPLMQDVNPFRTAAADLPAFPLEAVPDKNFFPEKKASKAPGQVLHSV